VTTSPPLALDELLVVLRGCLLDRGGPADPGGHAPDELSGSTRLVEDLGLDSLDLVEVATVLQELAGVPFDEFDTVPETVDDLYQEHLRSAGRRSGG
jgi:acyl carrier protein